MFEIIILIILAIAFAFIGIAIHYYIISYMMVDMTEEEKAQYIKDVNEALAENNKFDI